MTVEAVSSETQNHEISEEKEKGDLNGREVEIKKHMDNAKQAIKDFGDACIKGAAGIMSGHPLAAASGGIYIAKSSDTLVEACKEYGKAVELKNAAKGLDKFGNTLRHEVEHKDANEYEVDKNEKENERDSWDCEY